MRRFNYLFQVGLLASLLGFSAAFTSCGGDDNPAPDNQEQPDTPVVMDTSKVSYLNCYVENFELQHTRLLSGMPVDLILVGVSSDNIAQVAEILRGKSYSSDSSASYYINLELRSSDGLLATIPENTFRGCTGLCSVIVPAQVKEIGAGAFADCPMLKDVSILSSEAIVADGAFSGCHPDIIVDQEGLDRTVSVVFVSNGSITGDESFTITGNRFVRLPGQGDMSRPGFKFLGWAVNRDARKGDYEPDLHYKGGADTLYAVWRSFQFAITYHYRLDDPIGNPELHTGIEIERGNLHLKFRNDISHVVAPEGQFPYAWFDDVSKNVYIPGELLVEYRDYHLYPLFKDAQTVGSSFEDLSVTIYQ